MARKSRNPKALMPKSEQRMHAEAAARGRDGEDEWRYYPRHHSWKAGARSAQPA